MSNAKAGEQSIYFAKTEDGSLIKIGITGMTPEVRVLSLTQAGRGVMVLIGSISGNITIEGQIHRQLKNHLVHGREWFNPSREVIEFIDETLARGHYLAPSLEPDKAQQRRLIGYVRCSTDKQQISLEAQEVKIRAMSVVKDLIPAEIIIDSDASAKSLDRPGMERIMGMIDAGEVDILVVAKLDRLTRSVKDLATLLEKLSAKRVTLISVEESLDTGSAAGRLVLNIMMSVSQWEREAIGERTKIALQHQKSNGYPAGKAPFGWTRLPKLPGPTGRLVSQPLVINNYEQEIMKEATSLRNQGLSYQSIANVLNNRGLKTRAGIPWVKQYVIGILKNSKDAAA